MDNLTFLNSLTFDLREEVLMTSTQDFLNTLPEDIQQEAQRLRDRLLQRFAYNHGDLLNIIDIIGDRVNEEVV